MSIQDLRERRNAIAKEMRNLLDSNKEGAWKANNCQAKWDELNTKLDDTDAEIARHQKMLDADAEDRFKNIEDKLKKGDKPENQASLMYNKWLRRGDNALTAEEWQAIRNTMSTGTSNEGGFTVQTEIAKSILEALKSFGGMREVSEVFQTEAGASMQFPTSDGTAEEGEIIGENQSATDADPNFGTVGLGVHKYSSKVVAIPFELIQDSQVDVEAFVQSRLATRLGRITNRHFTKGTGTNEPRGLITALNTGKVGATGKATSVDYDDLIDLIESIDEAYMSSGKARFMLHQQSRKAVRKLKDTAGRPLWTPSYDGGISRGLPEQLLGYDLKINNDMPVMAANAKSIAFGDFSYYKIRDVMSLTLFRFTDSAYTKKGQVGFLAWMRSGGNWVDVGGAAKTFQNSAT